MDKKENVINIPTKEGYETIVKYCDKCKYYNCNMYEDIKKGFCYCFMKNK